MKNRVYVCVFSGGGCLAEIRGGAAGCLCEDLGVWEEGVE